jgi:uncharacterized repeat protein (TIGR01451 family)
MKANNTMGIVRTARWALGAAVLLCVGVAQAAGKLEISNSVFQEVAVQTEDGRTERRQAPVTRVIPGNEVIYVISYRNVGDGPVANVAITNPVPNELIYVASAGAIQVSEVSVDQGERYGDLSDLTVPGPDGAPRPAQPADVTHLRWNLPELPAGSDGAVSFTARVR